LATLGSVSPGKTKLGIPLLNKKLDAVRSLLDDIKTKKLNGMDMFREWKRGDYRKKL
jgi:hypothetical protein